MLAIAMGILSPSLSAQLILFIGAMVATFSGNRQNSEEFSFFQSPFHRGNGCYEVSGLINHDDGSFQSPFHRGNGCYCDDHQSYRYHSICLSVPFSSGQWLLRRKPARSKGRMAFSPLFIGAMVATGYALQDNRLGKLSVPFSSGQWLLLIMYMQII